jgi:enolase
MKIADITALQIFDSRGNPTVEAQVILEDGTLGRGLVPSGASRGEHEAWELRDGDPARLLGRSVFGAVENVEREIAPALRAMDALDQRAIDERMIALDGTPNKRRLGANAILAVSLAVADAAARSRRQPLFCYLGRGTLIPMPEIQIIGGGAHADWATDVQDFMIMPVGASSYRAGLEMVFNVYHTCGRLLREKGKLHGVADEGGFYPDCGTHDEIFELLHTAIRRAGYTPGKEVALSLDIAASELYRDGRYRFRLEDRTFTPSEFGALIAEWCEHWNVVSVEDPMAENDWDGWQQISRMLGERVQLIGDDLFTTNPARIREGIERNAANAVLIKLNQIGTVTETLDAIRLTQDAGWLPVVSARSGETEDAFISHLAVATDAGQLKVGSFSRSERMAKWNELLRIERALGRDARYEGGRIFSRRADKPSRSAAPAQSSEAPPASR